MDVPFGDIVVSNRDKFHVDVDLLFLFTAWYLENKGFKLLIANETQQISVLDNWKKSNQDFPIKVINKDNVKLSITMSQSQSTFVALFEGVGQSAKSRTILLELRLHVNGTTDVEGKIDIINRYNKALGEIGIESREKSTNENLSLRSNTKFLSKESALFLWHQLLLFVLKQIPRDERAKDEFIHQWKRFNQFNENELNLIERFRENYDEQHAIEWYTKECSLYKVLNRILRTENIQLIYSIRYFLVDLSREIEKESLKDSSKNLFTVYRGQCIQKDELDQWRNHIGSLISINSYFSTSHDPHRALQFAVRRTLTSKELLLVIFEIQVDPNLRSIIYADIAHRTVHVDEQEILFDFNSLFKIVSIEEDSMLNIWKIRLQTTEHDRQDVEKYRHFVEEEINECSPTIYFGWLLLDELDQIDQAETYFRILLQRFSNDHPDYPSIYNGIGRVYSVRNQLELALENYQIARQIRQQTLPDNHLDLAIHYLQHASQFEQICDQTMTEILKKKHLRLAASLHNIGNILREKEQFDSALDYLQQALGIEEIYYPNDHLQKAVIIQNIANTLTRQGVFKDTHEKFSCAYEMFKRLLPEKHPKISACLIDMGFLCESEGDLNEALKYYHQAFDMDVCCLPMGHSLLIKDFRYIGYGYRKKKDLETFRRFVEEKLRNFESNPTIDETYIARISMAIGEIIEDKFYRKAFQFYENAWTRLQKSKSIDREAIGKCLENMGRLYGICGQFDQAFPKLFEALKYYRQVWSFDHIDIARVYRTIAFSYRGTKDVSKALEYFNKSLVIYQTHYGCDHTQVKDIEKCIVELNNQQKPGTLLDGAHQQNLEKEQLTIASKCELIKENSTDQQTISITVSDIQPTIIEPSSILNSEPVVTSVAVDNASKTDMKKLSNRSSRCSNCQIL